MVSGCVALSEVILAIKQDHRAIKGVARPMLNFKTFHCACNVLAGIELMHMICKNQVAIENTNTLSFADQFYALTGQIRPD
jgi:putative transposase